MAMTPAAPRVILRRCETPDPARVHAIVRECFEELGVRPSGRVLIKPNVVTANRVYIHHSYTHPGVIEGIVSTLREGGVSDITVGESSGIGIPPGLFLHEAGYDALARRIGVRLVDFNQDAATWVDLKRAVCQKGFHVPRAVLDADTKIWAPKLKYHICCEVTNALKLNIGILQHRDRMVCHDDRLNDKIVDLLEIGWPDLVVTDATTVGHGFESAPQGFPLGLLLVADNPLAADAVAGAALGYRPENIVHLRIASERGYGTISLDAIGISGDYPLDELASKTKHIVSEYQDIHRVETPLKFYCGDNPATGRFCYGGCLAAVKGALGTTDKRRPGSVRNAQPGGIVTGDYGGDVLHAGQTVFLVGDCTHVAGRFEARRVVRLRGCPVRASQLLMRLPRAFRMPSPMSDGRSAAQFVYYTLRHALVRLFGRGVRTGATSAATPCQGAGAGPRLQRHPG
jgi:uncharacterized protein (DUF362 family)